ncbi:MAG: helix-turn-helix transcriptional regulator [Chloroflexi bacterium]|nr:helix-turn-helix transcriptional regulator [Chloroflexota bacterium]
MKNIVGPRIRNARLQRGNRISQEELAARLQALGVDLDQGAISRIENGDRQVTDIEVLGVCLALGISMNDLFEGTELPQQT